MVTKVTPDVMELPPATGGGGGGRNSIINGDFQIWQRGTNFAGPLVNGQYTADRWVFEKQSTSATHSIAQSTDVPTVAQAGSKLPYSLLVTCTGAAAVSPPDIVSIVQKVEGFNWVSLAQRACVLSFWVKATVPGAYGASLLSTGGDSCVLEFTVNAANTWEKKVLAFPASPVAGLWNYASGIGIRVGFALMSGSYNQTVTPGVWSGSLYRTTVNQVNFSSAVNNTFRIAAVDLRPGTDAPATFEARLYNDELLLCERYYQILYGRDYGVIGQAFDANTVFAVLRFRTLMRGGPSVILAPAGMDTNGQVVFFTATGYYPGSAGDLYLNSAIPDSMVIYVAGAAGYTAGQASLLFILGGAMTPIAQLSAEL